MWARVAALSFGGPAGQIAVMHRILVEEKRWISENRFLHALNYCMLLPGPEAQQLATYIGWLLHGTRGGLLAGGLFIVPGIVAIMALSYIYAAFGDVGIVAALFFGLKAAVLADGPAGGRAGRRAALKNRRDGRDRRRRLRRASSSSTRRFHSSCSARAPSASSAGEPASTQFPGWAAGMGRGATRMAGTCRYLLGDDDAGTANRPHRRRSAVAAIWLASGSRRSPRSLAAWPADVVQPDRPVLHQDGHGHVWWRICRARLCGAAGGRDNIDWLKPGEMLDGLGMAETTPGPLIMVLQFVGFMAAFRDPGALAPDAGRHPRRPAGHVGDLHAVLLVDIPWRALHRSPAGKQGPEPGRSRRSRPRWSG